MPNSQVFEILLESQCETLTVGDVRMEASGPTQSPIEGRCIQSGETECLTISGPSEPMSAGNLSIYAGAEKIGTLNWNCSARRGEVPADWTPLSKNFTTSVIESNGAGATVAQLILRVARPFSTGLSCDKMAVATGHLGFAGI